MTASIYPLLRQRVDVLRASLTPDGAGGQTTVWTTLTSLWASVEPGPASNALERAQDSYSNDYRVTVRYDASLALSTDDRLRWEGLVLRIVELPPPLPEASYRTLLCRDDLTL